MKMGGERRGRSQGAKGGMSMVKKYNTAYENLKELIKRKKYEETMDGSHHLIRPFGSCKHTSCNLDTMLKIYYRVLHGFGGVTFMQFVSLSSERIDWYSKKEGWIGCHGTT